MKAVFEKLDLDGSASFLYRTILLTAFDAPFHFHPEYELTLIHKGEGQRYVGTKVDDYTDNDLVLLGANLPHCWLTTTRESSPMVSSTVIQFKSDFLGKDFLDLPEMTPIKTLLERSKSGLKVTEELKPIIVPLILAMKQQSDFTKILTLLEVLGILANTKTLEELDVVFYENEYSDSQNVRFQRVFSYLIGHFKEEISLDKIAEVANLSPTSFCRYFKAITGKTFLEMLNEYRIQSASISLKNNKLPINQIALESGFNDIPYFNKLFKKQKGFSPLVYRKNLIGKI